MNDIKLVESGVVFTSNPHSYHLGDKELKGVTGILKEHIFTNKYFNVSQEVLDAAAERGTMVHEQCRAVDLLDFAASSEAVAYEKIKKELGVTTIANEYTVSDNEFVASNIDAVYEIGGEIWLCDFKTTSHLDVEYLSWQLSIYKYLFELQNPSLKVSRLIGIWLPLAKYGKPRAEVVPMKPMEEVKALLEADARGEKYTPLAETVPSEVLVLQQRCYDIVQQMAVLKMESDELHKALYKAMEEYDVKKWETDYFTCTRVLPTVQQKFDSKKFKEDHADLYDLYKKETKVSGSVKITLKKQKE